MSNSFTALLGRHLNRFTTRISGGLSENSRQIDPSGANITGSALPPDQVLAMMQGDSAFMKQFEQSVEQSFNALGDRVLDRWMQDVDGQMRRSLQEVIHTMGDFAGEMNSVLEQGGSLSDALSQGAGKFGEAIGNITGGLLQSALTRTKTNIAESQRSLETSSQFRNSRGQMQADMSEQLARGKRYV